MCFKFTNEIGIIPKAINFTGNAAIMTVGGIALAAISYLALKALGFSSIAATVAAIPLTIGMIGTAGTLFAGLGCIALFIIAVKSYR